MLRSVCILALVYLVYCKDETLSELQTLFDDPELFRELEKRLGILPDDGDDSQNGFEENEVSCFALTGTLPGNCGFQTSNGTIIKTRESMDRGAEFLQDFSNFSCAKDCTAECCENPDCDTAVYQDKDEHNCYLFKCGEPSQCVFAHHTDYWMSSVSENVHNSHVHDGTGATTTHENELHGLQGYHNKEPVSEPEAQTTTTVRTTTVGKPALEDWCESYHTECEDQHAECMYHKCQCRVGYHAKHGLCRKRCRKTEFECDNEGYGPNVPQCVHSSYVCDGNKDCVDNSDEYVCPDTNPAYPDRGSMLDRTLYNSPVYQSPYNQPENKYPYGYPLQGLANQQVQLPQGSNQIYPAQVPTNQQIGGQYYIPGLTIGSQVGVPQTGSQLNSAAQLPYMDKGYGVAMPPYQNNVPYQNLQQQQYVPNQQSGFVPLVPNTVNNAVQPNQNIQPLNANVNSNLGTPQGNLANQVAPPAANQPIQIAQPANQAPVASQPQPNKNNNIQQVIGGKVIAQGQGQAQSNIYQTDVGNYPAGSQGNSEQNGNSQQQKPYPEKVGSSDYNGMIQNQMVYDQRPVEGNTGYHPGGYVPATTTTVAPFAEDWQNRGREPHKQVNSPRQPANSPGPIENYHSQEYEDRNQNVVPAGKSDSQIDVTTGSIVPEQKVQGHSNSEGFQDFSSWMHYDNDPHRISGKKGAGRPPNPSRPKPPNKPPSQVATAKPETKTDRPAVRPKVDSSSKQTSSDKPDHYNNRMENHDGKYDTDQQNGHKNGPSYHGVGNNRIQDKQGPNYGSKYPYFDDPSYRNRGRYRFPVWDPYRDEYYYPDDMDNRRLGASSEVDYEDYRPDVNPSLPRPHYGHKTDNKRPSPDMGETQQHAGKPDIQEHPNPTQTEPSTTETTRNIPTSTADTQQPVATDIGSAESTESQASDNTDDKESSVAEPDSKDTETQSTEETSKNSNKTETGSKTKEQEIDGKEDGSEKEKGFEEKGFDLFGSDKVEVVSYTDNTQGPIIALALGLAITMIMLIFVGCRLRTVKRRLRKGRALHSNEADYLINGMYL